MHSCVSDILDNCGVESTRATPAASTLINVRETTRATELEFQVVLHTRCKSAIFSKERLAYIRELKLQKSYGEFLESFFSQ
jgi:hypothetical protein